MFPAPEVTDHRFEHYLDPNLNRQYVRFDAEDCNVPLTAVFMDSPDQRTFYNMFEEIRYVLSHKALTGEIRYSEVQLSKLCRSLDIPLTALYINECESGFLY